MFIRVNVKIEGLTINRVVRYFVLADLLFTAAWGLVSPALAVFIIQKISGGTVFVVGITLAVYWLTRALLQLPVGILIDEHQGEKDDFYVLIISLMMAGFASLLFLAVDSIPSLLLSVFLMGIAFALYQPSWSAIFSRHLDQKHFAVDWSLDNAAAGVAVGIAALAGGALAKWVGFPAVFIGASLLAFIGAAILLLAPDLVLPRGSTRGLFHRGQVPLPPPNLSKKI